MSKDKKQLDMLHGSLWSKVPVFVLPVAATAILEQLFNASDVAVVGNFTGEQSTAVVAAVGANSPIISLIVNLFIGVALGANVVIAHAVGRGDKNTVKKAVHTLKSYEIQKSDSTGALRSNVCNSSCRLRIQSSYNRQPDSSSRSRCSRYCRCSSNRSSC